MADVKNIICIVCPLGCRIDVRMEKGKIERISGYSCKRGKEYAENECMNPVRVVTSTVRVVGGEMPVAAVKTEKPIPKGLVMDCIREISKRSVTAPISIGDVIIENLLNTGINIVSTGNIPALCKEARAYDSIAGCSVNTAISIDMTGT